MRAFVLAAMLCAFVMFAAACQGKEPAQSPAPEASPSAAESGAPIAAASPTDGALSACTCPQLPVAGTAEHPSAGTVAYELSADDLRAIFSNRDLRYGEDWTLALQSLAYDMDPDGRLKLSSGAPPAPANDTPVVEGGLSAQWTAGSALGRVPAERQNPYRFTQDPRQVLQLLIATIARSNKYGETRRGLREGGLALAQFSIEKLAQVPSSEPKGQQLAGFASGSKRMLLQTVETMRPLLYGRAVRMPEPKSSGELPLESTDIVNAALDVLSWRDTKGVIHELSGGLFPSGLTGIGPAIGSNGDLGADLVELASMGSAFGAPVTPGSPQDAVACKAYQMLLRLGVHGDFNAAIYHAITNTFPDDSNGSTLYYTSRHRAALAALKAIGFANDTQAQDFAHGLFLAGLAQDRPDGRGAENRAAIIEAMRGLAAHGGKNDAGADAFYQKLESSFQELRVHKKSGSNSREQNDFLARWDALQAAPGGGRAPASAPPPCAKELAGRAFLVMRPRRPDEGDPNNPAEATVDFANQKIGAESNAHIVWLGNTGDGPLLVQKVELPARTVFRIDDSACTSSAVEPLGHCELLAYFKPADDAFAHEKVRVVTNAGTQRVWLEGTGTRNEQLPGSVERWQQHIPFRSYRMDRIHGACENTKLVGWYAIFGSDAPSRLEGQVVENHVASDDFAGVHFSQDYNFFVYPDQKYRGNMAIPGNFEEGDPYELGRVEVEWERRRVTSNTHLAAGFPQWAWPAQGDRIRVDGIWIYDCGHHDSGPYGYRAEIHPPRFAVTYRNNALAETGGVTGRLGSYHEGPDGRTWATRADVFGSSYGGDAIWSELGSTLFTSGRDKWFQPVNDRDYQFLILAPPKPSPDAVLTYWECNHLTLGDCAAQGLPSSDTPVYGATQPSVEITELPSSASLPGYKVRVHFKGMAVPDSHLMIVGRTIWAGWKRIEPKAAGAIGPHLRSYEVTFDRVNITKVLASIGSGDWTMWRYVNENAGALFSGNGETLLGEPLKDVSTGETLHAFELSNRRAQGTLVDQQPLRIKILGAKYNRITNGEAGTADIRLFDTGPRSGLEPLTPKKVHGNHTLYGFPVDATCPDTGCFDAAAEVTISTPH